MLKVAVVGVGHLGFHHVRKFSQMENVNLSGIYDADPKRLASVASELEVHAFGSFEELLGACDAVDIVTTTSSHYLLAKQALLAGKHVFIEKPITSELSQAHELLAIAKERKLKVQVGHIERFNPVILAVEEDIRDPMFIESHRLSTYQPRGTDVPVVLDLMIHDIDLILDFIKSPVKHIHASGIGIITPSIDIANARIEFDNGAIANVTSSRVSMKQERKIRFFQRNAYFSLDFVEQRATVIKRAKNAFKYIPRIIAKDPSLQPEQLVDIRELDLSNPTKDALSMELESFVDAIIHDKQPVVDGEAGTRALEVAFKILEIIKTQPKTHI